MQLNKTIHPKVVGRSSFMAKLFYIRVSTEEQSEERQLLLAKQNGADEIFVDKASGKNLDREGFNKMMAYARKGDCIYVESLSRLSRSIRDTLKLLDEFESKGISFVSLKEKFDSSTPQGKFALTMFAALSTLEREMMLQRQAEGIAIKKAIPGFYKGRKPKQIDKTKFNAMVSEWREGKRTATSIMKEFNITSTTFYRWVNKK